MKLFYNKLKLLLSLLIQILYNLDCSTLDYIHFLAHIANFIDIFTFFNFLKLHVVYKFIFYKFGQILEIAQPIQFEFEKYF